MTEVVSIGSDCVRVKASQIGTIPVTTIGGKTRLLRPMITANVDFEISFNLHSSQLAETLNILQALFKNRFEKDISQDFLNSVVEREGVKFDLTSLSSHRETLLLPQALRAVRVKKMIEIFGLLQVTKEYLYFQPMANFGSRKVKKFALVSSSGSVTTNQMSYKLKDTCVEFLFPAGKNLLIQLASKADRDLLLSCLGPGCSPLLSVASLDVSAKLPGLETARELWRVNAISNYAYLMYLNFCSGRSVNDIGQYPVLPWTVVKGETFDLHNSDSFRDLSVPVAATNRLKLDQCRERAQHMPLSERFLFGSFYSNPAFVLYFLIRKFPECHLRLHGGHFDHTARLFTSVETAWQAVTEHGSVTMELIPEFYSDWDSASSWLENSPALTLIPEVTLPPWASSSRDFVIKMRCALESKHVSENLNAWIDLVFGVKSRGRQICLDNNNLFHPICYLQDAEGDVVQYCRDHDVRKDIVLLQSQEFGHVPKQLFVTESHPLRDLSLWKEERASLKYYEDGNGKESWRTEILNALVTMDPKKTTPKIPPSTSKAVSKAAVISVDKRSSWTFGGFSVTDFALGKSGDSVVVTKEGYLVSTFNDKRWRVSLNCINSITPFSDVFLCTDSVSGQIHRVSPTEGLLLSKRVHYSEVSCCVVLNDKLGVSGSRDQTVCVFELDELEPIHILEAHFASVQRIARVEAMSFLSADAKGLVAFWDLDKNQNSPIFMTYTSNNPIVSLHAVTDRALAVDSHGVMFLIDIHTGSILWRLSEVQLKYAYFPVGDDSSTVFGIAESSIHAFKITVGKGLAEVNVSGQVETPSHAKIAASSNSALLLSQDNCLQVLSVRNKYYNLALRILTIIVSLISLG